MTSYVLNCLRTALQARGNRFAELLRGASLRIAAGPLAIFTLLIAMLLARTALAVPRRKICMEEGH
ncbi:hypothetical protein [Sulfuricella sp.]|uniref:hypothetical protein n=1 Tax=Sulfuricella sp. TaxID=2099377 RepID=UPI002CF84DCF|nr:hypothetical protein [Sulfuricella sp.]HUX64925.1 hypothetical protein [Sulfuricella sp.]